MIKVFELGTNLVFENSIGSDNLFKEMLPDMRVHGRQRIVQ